MSTYEPGTVATLSVQGEDVRAIVRGDEWLIVGHSFFKSIAVGNKALIQSVHPLLVLDVEDWWRLFADLGAAVEACGNGQVSAHLRAVAEQVREQTKPPRIPEPGLWGVVKASVTYEGCEYEVKLVRHPGAVNPWQAPDGHWFDWSELVDPVLVRDGIEGES